MEKFLLVSDKVSDNLDVSLSSIFRNETETMNTYKSCNSAFFHNTNKFDEITQIRISEYIELFIIGFVEFGGIDCNWSSIKKDVVNKMKGAGFLIFFNKKEQEIIIVTDPWFRRTFYYTSIPQVAISTELKAITNLFPVLKNNISEEGLASFLAFHQFHSNTTLFEYIKSVPSGSTTIINTQTNDIFISHNYKYPFDYNYNLNYADTIKSLANLFTSHMSNLVNSRDFNAIFLSGGLDSRLLLSAIPSNKLKDIKAVHMGNYEVTETKYAELVANKLGVDFRLYKMYPELIINHASHNAWITEGGSFLGACMLGDILKEGNFNIIGGIPGDVTLGGVYADKFTKKSTLLESIFNKRMFLNLLSEEKGNRYIELISNLLDRELKLFDYVRNETLKLELYSLNNRVRKASFNAVSEHNLFDVPYLDNEIVQRSLEIPIEMRRNRKVQNDIMREINDDVWSIPSTSINATKKLTSRLKFKGFLMKVGKQIPIIKEFGRKYLHRKIATKTEDHYVTLNDWMRMFPSFKEFICNKLQSLNNRDIIIKGITDKLVDEHMNKSFNHMNTLSVLVDLELIFETFVDDKMF